MTKLSILLIVAIVSTCVSIGYTQSSSSNPGQNNQIQNSKLKPLRGVPQRAYRFLRLGVNEDDDLFLDDDNIMQKRQYDDYGHMRFGKRQSKDFDDYGHLRFGK